MQSSEAVPAMNAAKLPNPKSATEQKTVTTPEASSNNALSVATRTFRETGYVVLDNLYPTDWIASLRATYEEVAARYVADRGGIEALEGKTFGKNHIGVHPALVPPFSDPQIVAHPVVDALLSHLLGADYQCGYYHTNAAYPGSGIQPIHRDVPPLFSGAELNVPHPVTSIVLNVPLCDFTEENGSTEVWPGSHLLVDHKSEDQKEVTARAAMLPSKRTNVPAGSAILRDLRMFHRGMPNDSERVRAMLAIVYVRSFRATGTLDIAQSTWENWPERARQIFRNNRVVSDEETPAHYRLTKSAQ
jgi:ectoine hydroxylase-related dioxygenase (phytanoyl-CoA dioxygenase family)